MTFQPLKTSAGTSLGEIFALERDRLAPAAMHTEFSKGRRYAETEHPYRPPYVRDRDRIIHCAAFRRLAHKTQVFADQPNDHHRSRLTHTLEVAQIARTVARNLGLHEDFTEAVALAHDLGHPPFGHAGERVLAELTANHGGFEHNRQGLRLVERWESRYPQFLGLNLTYEVLESLALHSKSPSAAEIAEFGPNRRMLAEVQLVDLSDSIAYSTHDIDDALRHGLISFADLAQVELWRESEQRARSLYGKSLEGKQLARGVIRSIIDTQVGSMIEEGRRRLAGIGSPDEVRGLDDAVIALPTRMAAMHESMRRFLFERVYRHPAVTRQTAEGENRVRQLFHALIARPELIPEKYRSGPDDPVERQACDYIASMTDRFARRLHQDIID